jgi:hypothetical protein
MVQRSSTVALTAQEEFRRNSGGIMELTLTVEERELVLEILSQRHRELLREISHTDHREFKLALHNKEKLLESVVNRLRVIQPTLEPMPELRH